MQDIRGSKNNSKFIQNSLNSNTFLVYIFYLYSLSRRIPPTEAPPSNLKMAKEKRTTRNTPLPRPLNTTPILTTSTMKAMAMKIKAMTIKIKVMTIKIKVMTMKMRALPMQTKVMTMQIKALTLKLRTVTMKMKVMTMQIKAMNTMMPLTLIMEVLQLVLKTTHLEQIMQQALARNLVLDIVNQPLSVLTWNMRM